MDRQRLRQLFGKLTGLIVSDYPEPLCSTTHRRGVIRPDIV
jgi:hypothetical protein